MRECIHARHSPCSPSDVGGPCAREKVRLDACSASGERDGSRPRRSPCSACRCPWTVAGRWTSSGEEEIGNGDPEMGPCSSSQEGDLQIGENFNFLKTDPFLKTHHSSSVPTPASDLVHSSPPTYPLTVGDSWLEMAAVEPSGERRAAPSGGAAPSPGTVAWC